MVFQKGRPRWPVHGFGRQAAGKHRPAEKVHVTPCVLAAETRAHFASCRGERERVMETGEREQDFQRTSSIKTP